jgi:hypothetical protein
VAVWGDQAAAAAAAGALEFHGRSSSASDSAETHAPALVAGRPVDVGLEFEQRIDALHGLDRDRRLLDVREF